MSIATEITRLQGAKSALKTAINAKNDNSHQITNETIDNYANFVDDIQTGSTPSLQDKSITIKTNTTTNITADTGYDGLGTVSVTTNVPTGGTTPSIGIVFTDWDIYGRPTKATTYGYSGLQNMTFTSEYSTGTLYYWLTELTLNEGMTMIGQKACINEQNLQHVNFPSTLTTIQNDAFNICSSLANTSLPNSVTTIQSNAFTNCSSLALTSLPSSLSSLGSSAFSSCSALAISQIPDTLTSLKNSVFNSCTSIKKISMDKVTAINGSATSTGSFRACTGLKQVWIGSSITTIGLYSFYGCTALEKIYVNLPRATVEAMANYDYAWMGNSSKVGIIVCNDDSGFINKATFDAQVIS